MSFPNRSAWLSIFLSVAVLSIPITDKISPAAGFTVHQVSNPRFVANETQHLRASYAKYQSYSNQSTNASNAASGASDEVVATPVAADSEYLVPVTVQGQELIMNIDTGSADFWVFSTNLPASQQIGHTCFNATENSTFHTLAGYKWGIKYGDQSSAQGTVGVGEVNIGGGIVPNQAVELATSVSSTLVSDTYSNGIAGFGFDIINTVTPNPQKSWFDNLKATLPLPLFTADLKHNEPGSYDFGFIDESKFVGGSISYHDVNTSNGFWQFQAAGYAVGDGKVVTPKKALYPAIMDTGTTLLMLQESMVVAYYDQVPDADYLNSQEEEGFVVPCGADLPDFTIQVGNYSAVIGAEYLVYGQISETYCYGSIQISGGNLNVFGDIFFKSQFVVFDAGSPARLGFAPKS